MYVHYFRLQQEGWFELLDVITDIGDILAHLVNGTRINTLCNRTIIVRAPHNDTTVAIKKSANRLEQVAWQLAPRFLILNRTSFALTCNLF